MYTSGHLGHMNINHDVKSFHRNSVDVTQVTDGD